MKKILLVLTAVIISVNVMAQHEIGIIAGGINGVSYKCWLTTDWALQTDLAVGLTAAPGSVFYKGFNYGTGTNSQYDFTLNPNLEYHFPLASILKLYVGAGVNLGLISDLNNTDPNLIMGKAGGNGIVGFVMAPGSHVAIALDFRPGYGIAFYDADTPHFSFFDWKLGLAIRYRI